MIEVCVSSDKDIDTLAILNRQLIEDEKFDVILDIEELKERMTSFLKTDYKAYIFYNNNDLVGYALVNINKNPYYLRHFFICRDKRKKGYGRSAFYKLLDILKIDSIDLEVLVWNEVGIEFWKSLGLKERSLYLRYNEAKNR